jgi:PPOX class probable F420-dependent enzyme
MLDFASRFGRRVRARLRRERIVWLTTVDAEGTPQPRPVWFHWDGKTILIFSEAGKAKLRHIARNPRVALHFNTDPGGGEVAVLIGEALIPSRAPPRHRVEAYLRKYREGIASLEMTTGEFRRAYRVPVVVTPRRMRGFIG